MEAKQLSRYYVVPGRYFGMLQMGGSWEVWKLVIPTVLGMVVSWLYASLTKVSKTDHAAAEQRLEKIIEKQGERISKFESALNDRVTKAELKEAMNDLKSAITEMRSEVREDFVTLRALFTKA